MGCINYLDRLNITLYELISDLIKVFPEDGDFRMYLLASKTAIAIDDTFLYNVLTDKVVMYEDQIMAKDERFLLNFDIEGQIEVSSVEVKQHVLHVIGKLRHVWTAVSHDNREIIWRYFKTMILLHHKITV